MKKLIWILMLVLMPSTAFAALCEDRVDSNVTCTVVTPVLTCSDNASIYNMTGSSEVKQMSLMNDSIYNFTFIEVPEGTYVIRLCDNSTTSIAVRTTLDRKVSMIDFGIILLFIIITAVFFWLSHVNEDVNLRLLFFGVGFIFVPLTFSVAFGLANDYGVSAAISGILEKTMVMMWILTFVIIFYCSIVLITNFIKAYIKKQDDQNKGLN